MLLGLLEDLRDHEVGEVVSKGAQVSEGRERFEVQRSDSARIIAPPLRR